MSQTVVSMLAMPPRENSSSIVLVAAGRHESVRHRRVDRLDAVGGALVGLVDERLDGVGLGERGQHAGEQRAAEDGEERRCPPEREDDQEHEGRRLTARC